MPPLSSAAGAKACWLGPIVASILAFLPGLAAATECHVDTSLANEVRFISDAPIEDFEGVTDRIDGYAFWKGDSLAIGDSYEGSEIYFEVPLNALSTGIDLRDRHMRENYLHTDRYPYVSYKGRIHRVLPDSAAALRVVTSGLVELHGKKKEYQITCRVSRRESRYHVAAEFEIKLPDFGIEVPSLMFMKVNETVQVKVNFHVRPVG